MKKMWKICVVTLAAAVLTALAACSARTAVSADGFREQAKDAGFTVAAPASDDSGASKSLTATKDGTDVQIDYHQFASASSAQSWYASQKGSLAGSGKTVVDSDAYNRYTLTNGEIRYVLVRMDSTAILCKTTSSRQGEGDNFLKSIRY